MYEASSPVGAGAYFSEIKELLYEAIAIAREMGFEDEVKEIDKRLNHIRGFTNLRCSEDFEEGQHPFTGG